MANGDLLQWMNDFARNHGLSDERSGSATVVVEDKRLQRKYEKLGGDKALLRLLADEDRYFHTALDKERELALEWQRKRVAELQHSRERYEAGLARMEHSIPHLDAWHRREQPIHDRVLARSRKLGDKLKTETGKELAQDLHWLTLSVERAPGTIAKYRRYEALARQSVAGLERRLADVEDTYEAIERRIRDARAEPNDVLELDAMTLEQKVKRLRQSSTRSRSRRQEKLEAELRGLYAETERRLENASAAYVYHSDPDFEDPIDWPPVEKKIAALEATSLESMVQKDRQGHDGLTMAYLEAGGDRALLEKDMKMWRDSRAIDEHVHKRNSAEDRAELERLQQRLTEAHLAIRDAEKPLGPMRARHRETEERVERLSAGASDGDLLSERESAELRVFARAAKQLERDIANQEAIVAARRRAAKSAEEVLEQKRQMIELYRDDDVDPPMAKPQAKDLAREPLKSKYLRLTGEERKPQE